ncbi:Rac GTPase [Pelomyxa schiedti]|nr:Rac GTPase [Pelomyxa schiedti]
MINMKMVVVGDGGVGKTCLISVMQCHSMPSPEYTPTTWDNPIRILDVDRQSTYVTFWDTAGQEDYDRLRPLSYPETDVFLVCFSVHNRESFLHVTSKWYPEVRHHCPLVPILLVGLKSDLYGTPQGTYVKRHGPPVSFDEGITLARNLKAYGYFHTSSLKGIGVEETLIEAVHAASFRGPLKTPISKFAFSWFSKVPEEITAPPRPTKPVSKSFSVWTKFPSGVPRYGHATVVIGKLMYIFGGSNERHQTQNCEILRFDLFAEKWLSPVPLPPEFCGAVFPSVVSHAGSLFAFGGRSSRYTSTIIIGTPESSGSGVIVKFVESAMSPPARFGATAVVKGSDMLMFGGFDSVTSMASNDLYVLSLTDLSWKQIEIPEHTETVHVVPPRYHHSSVVYGNSMIIFGGIGTRGTWLNDLWRVDLTALPSCSQLLATGATPPAMRGHAACVCRNSMFIFGCEQNSTDDKLFQLDLNSMFWTEVKTGGIPSARDFHSLVCPNDRLLVVYGGQMRTTKTDDILGDCRVLDLGPQVYDLLPSELWLEIFSYVDFIALIRLSRTCKSFHVLAKTEPLWSNAQKGTWTMTPKDCGRIIWKNTTFTYEPSKPSMQPYVPPPRSHSPTVCFGPNATFKDANQGLLKMTQLAVGTKIVCGDGTIGLIECIWRYELTQPTELIKHTSPCGGVLEITPDHPICHQGKWCLPTELGEPTTLRHDVTTVYNMVMSNRHSVQVGGVECCTVGQPVPPPLFDSYWGSEAIVSWLHNRPDFPNVTTYQQLPIPKY